jgi:hypothetical protein
MRQVDCKSNLARNTLLAFLNLTKMNVTNIVAVVEIALGLAAYFIPQAGAGLATILIGLGLSTLGIRGAVTAQNVGGLSNGKGLRW